MQLQEDAFQRQHKAKTMVLYRLKFLLLLI